MAFEEEVGGHHAARRRVSHREARVEPEETAQSGRSSAVAELTALSPVANEGSRQKLELDADRYSGRIHQVDEG